MACDCGRVEHGLHDFGRRIDLADADDALVGVDADHQVVLAAVGNGAVDARLAQDDGFDFGDLHCASLSSSLIIDNQWIIA